MRVGSGKFTYELAEGWGRLPTGWSLGEVAAVAVDSRDRVYVFNRSAHPIIVFDREGNFLTSWGEGLFTTPHGIYIGPDDSVYCADASDHTVRKLTPDGKLLMTLGQKDHPSDTGYDGQNLASIKRGAGPFNRPTNIALSPSGEIYVSDGYGNARVHKFSPDGKLLKSWGEPGTGPGQFNLPHGICVDKRGVVYAGDRQNDRIQVFSPEGEFVTQWTEVIRPNDLWLDAEENLFVAGLGLPPTPVGKATLSHVSSYSLDGKLLARLGGEEVDTSTEAGQGLVAQAGGGLSWLTGRGIFYAAHAVRADSRGDLYVGEVTISAFRGTAPPGAHVFQKFIRVST